MLSLWHRGAALCGVTAAALLAAPGLGRRVVALMTAAADQAPQRLAGEALRALTRLALTLALGAALGVLAAALLRRWLLPHPAPEGPAPRLIDDRGAAPTALAIAALAAPALGLLAPAALGRVLKLAHQEDAVRRGAAQDLAALAAALLCGGAALHLAAGLWVLLRERRRAGAG